MGTLDLDAVLDTVGDAAPGDLIALLRSAAAPLGASELSVFLADFQGTVLQPMLLSPDMSEAFLPEEDITASMAGRAFTTGEPVTADREGGVRVWLPLVERGDRTGVLALTLPAVDDAVMAECVRLGLFAGLLVRAFARTTDLLHLRRRARSMSVAAGMQWDLLPPLTVRCYQALVCGRLEPAYEIAGDAFDYALNGGHLDAALFDGMGHGVQSTMMTTLAIGAYRHARRNGAPPPIAQAAIDAEVSAHYDGEAFVTGVLMRLGLDDGSLEWTNAGHPLPLLLRGERVVKELQCPPSLPLGLGGGPPPVARESLEPGDAVLIFTDGVIEGRSAGGEDFGVDRLAHLWVREWTSGQPPAEVLRRLVRAVSEFSAGKLRDDATLLQLCWFGRRST